MFGRFYGVSVGPGDPELMTVKAVNTIKKCEVIAFPGKNTTDTVAYQIAAANVPEMADKTLLPLEMPMSANQELLAKAHGEAAEQIEKYLAGGTDVAFLVLGDATIYSTYMYLQELVSGHGYDTAIVSGVTSFCAAAAEGGISLCQWDDKLVVIPSRHQIPDSFEEGTNYILMKAGSRLAEIRKKLLECGREAICVENCGMANEKIYDGVGNLPDRAGYYTVVIVKS